MVLLGRRTMNSLIAAKEQTKYFKSQDGHLVVIEWEAIEGLCPKETDRFLEVLAFYGLSAIYFACSYEPEDNTNGYLVETVTYFLEDDDFLCEECATDLTEPMNMGEESVPGLVSQRSVAEVAEEGAKEIITAWRTLQKAFESVTKVGDTGLSLGIGRNIEDDFQLEPYYTVDNAYQLSPAGEKVKDKL